MSKLSQNSIRLTPRSADFLNRRVGARGEIFYDQTSNTLRIYDSRILGGTQLATENYVDTAIGNINIPEVDLTGLATENYVDTAIGNIDIPEVDLTGLATETFVGTAISNLVAAAPSTLDTLNELATALGNDANFATTVATALGTKAPINDPAFTGSVGIGGTASIIQGTGKSGTYLDVKGFIQINANNQNSSIDFTNFQNYRSANIESGQAGELGGPYLNINVSNSNTSSSVNNTAKFTSAGTGTTSTTTGALTIVGGVGISDGITVGGLTTLQQSTELLDTKTGATGTVTHDFSTGAIWYHSSISANFTANFTNVPTTNNRAIGVVLILVQGATPYIPNAVQIAGAAQTILWQDNTVPTGNANKRDLASFTLIRTGSTWTVLGSLSTYG
jgi:hypothetical protein